MYSLTDKEHKLLLECINYLGGADLGLLKNIEVLENSINLHWSNLIFFEDLNIFLKDNLSLFNLILKENYVGFMFVLKLKLINSFIFKLYGHRGNNLLLKILEEVLLLEYYKCCNNY